MNTALIAAVIAGGPVPQLVVLDCVNDDPNTFEGCSLTGSFSADFDPVTVPPDHSVLITLDVLWTGEWFYRCDSGNGCPAGSFSAHFANMIVSMPGLGLQEVLPVMGSTNPDLDPDESVTVEEAPQIVSLTFESADPSVIEQVEQGLSVTVLTAGQASCSISAAGKCAPDMIWQGVVVLDLLSTCTPDADLNGDGVVDVQDLITALACYRNCAGPPALGKGGGFDCDECDTNCDGVIDINDIINVILNWS